MIFRAVFKFFVAAIAVLMIVIGIIVAPSPIPFGIIFILLGFFLLAAVAPDLVRWLRRRWRWLDRVLRRLESALPRWMTRELRNTHPQDEEEEDEDDESEPESANRRRR